MPNTMLDVLSKLKARRRLYTQLTCGLIFLGLVGLYTFSHNANLMLQGTNPRFHSIGVVAAGVGEVFMLYAFVVGMFSAGWQRAAALLSDVAMLIVECARQRKESRGLHYVLDYPNPDDRWLRDTVLTRGDLE